MRENTDQKKPRIEHFSRSAWRLKKANDNDKIYKKVCFPVITKNKRKIFKEASCTNSIHYRKRCFFAAATFESLRVFSDSVKKSLIYFGLDESFLHFKRKDYEINTVYEKYI